MQFWFVRHGFDYYKDNPNLISWKVSVAEDSPYFKAFSSINKESDKDKIIYYSPIFPKPSTIPTGIVGIFEVKSKRLKKILGKEKEPSYYYKTAPLFLANGGHKPKKFIAKKVVGKVDGKYLKPEGTVVPLKPEQYRRIKAFLLGMEEPTNHKELENLFIRVHTYLGFQKIEKHQTQYPDMTAIDSEGNEKRIEFEFKSDSFLKEEHDPNKCDVIVCWEDTWVIDRPSPKKLQIKELQPLYGS